MRKILLALAMTAFIYTGADAQMCGNKTTTKHATKKTTTTHSTAAVTNRRAADKVAYCRVLPYKVCKIQADRKTVKCYETVDLDNLTPLNDEVTYYGPTGPMPDAVKKQTLPTLVVGNGTKGEYCRRDDANKSTVCMYNGQSMVRDANGNYSYR